MDAPSFTIDKAKRYSAELVTTLGTIVVALDPLAAPMTVNNFVYLARSGFYDGLTFHRVLPGFMIQGGDPIGMGTGGPGYYIKDEFASKLLFDKPGRLAMAHTPYPNSGGSQFFVTEVNVPELNGQYAIFGQCNDGLDIVKNIARVPIRGNPEMGRPVSEVFIKHIEITYK